MSEREDRDFCPRCGALMMEGTCRSCGYQDMEAGSAAPGETAGSGGYSPQYGGPAPKRKKKRTGLVVALCAGGMLLLLLLVTAACVLIGAVAGESIAGSELPYEDGGEYYDDYDSGYYEPSADDDYYEEITDSVRDDLEYQIVWASLSLSPNDTENNCSYYATWPKLTGSETLEAANAAITEMAQQYLETYEEYSGGCTSIGYVTYMDEEKVSIVFKHSLYQENGTLPRISALTFDVKTGEEIPMEEMAEVDADLLLRIRAQDKIQNGGVEYLEETADEELLAALADPERAVYFYSPVGLEIALNYESEEYGTGWVSVTLKEQAL